jgi:hypothetical protein
VGFLEALFVNPWFLAAAAGAALPIALHLIYRRRSREMPFSSLKFLHSSVKRTAHRKRLEELLLLALRVALIVLLALALARPFLGSGASPGSRAYTSMVLVLDDSGSMTCEHNKKSRFARAKAAADKLLGGLDAGDSVLLRLAGGRRLEKYDQLTSDRAYVRDELVKSRCTLSRGDLAGQIAEGLEELAGQSDPNREIYVLTDMQRTALRGLSARLATLDDRRISVVFVDVSDPDFRNAAVTDVVVRSRTRAAGEPATVQAQVRNTCAAKISPMVRLFVDDRSVAQQSLELEPGTSGSISFPCHLGATGVHHGRVEISELGDSLAFDNRRYFRTEVLSRVGVLVVEPRARTPGPGESQPGSFYLLRALDPLGGRGLIRPQLKTPADAEKTDLTGFAAVILSGLREIPQLLGARLRKHVADGGGLIVFPPVGADAESYAAAFGDGGDGRGPVLAARLGQALKIAPAGPGEAVEGLAVTALDFTHQVLLPFKGPARAGFRRVRVRRGLRLVVPENSRDPELITLAGPRPYLVARDFGRGRSYLFASPADADSSSLPLQKVFLPLLYCMIYDLAELGERRNEYLVGGRALLSFAKHAGSPRVRLRPPDGRTLELETSGEEKSCSFGPLQDAGVYRYTLLPGGSRGSFVVNPDPDESELETVGRREMARLFAGFRHVEFCAGPDEVDKVVARVRGGRDFSGNILALLLALAVFECFFANYMTKTRGNAPPGAESGS